MPDDPWMNVERIPQLAEELRALHQHLYDALANDFAIDRILTAAEFLEQVHKFIVSTPEILQRAKIAALFDAYQDIASALRDRAEDIAAGKRGPMRPQAALLQMAAALEKAASEHRRLLHEVVPPERPKPKLVIN